MNADITSASSNLVLFLAAMLLSALIFRTCLRPYSSSEHTFIPSESTKSRSARKAYSCPPGYFYNKDNLLIAHRTWGGDDSPKAVVVIVHGVGEHADRYEKLARTLVDGLGVVCVALDHQGHGRSEGDRLFVRNFEDYVEDVLQLCGMAEAKYGNAPKYLLGHSMGGLIAIRCFEKAQSKFHGAVFSAPALSVIATDLERKLAPWLSTKLPKLRRKKVDPELLCRDASIVDKYVNDPLVVEHGVTARLGDEILQAIDRSLAYAEEITTPYLLIRGEADQIALRPKIVDFHAKTKSPLKTFVEIKDYYHEIFNEKDSTAIPMVVAWFRERLAA